MLPKIYRTTVSGFYQNRQTAQKINLSFFTVLLKTNRRSVPRFVIAVPKVLEKRSVYRHRTKRLMEEEIRNKLDSLKNFPYDFSFKMKKILTRESRPVVGEEIGQMIMNIRINQKPKPL